MQMVRIGEGELGVGHTEMAYHMHVFDSCLFRFRPPVRAPAKKILAVAISLCVFEVYCANQLPTIDQRRITDASQFLCLIIIC